MNQHDIFGNPVAIPVRMPSSYESLPAPRVPSVRRFEEVASLSRSLIEKAGIHPGTYTTPYYGPFGPIEDVLEGMTGYLINALSGCDVVNLCKRLYDRHEEFLGHMNKSKYYSVPTIMYGDARSTSTNELELWQQVTPLTESLRWLIEVAVKHCKSPGITPGNAKVDHLIALATSVYMWDLSWEHIIQGVVPHELTIDRDFDMTFEPTIRGVNVQRTYKNALKPYLADRNREWVDSNQRPQERLTISRLLELPSLKTINIPLREERGYSMADWLRFVAGLTDSFASTKNCRLTKETRLFSFMSNAWKIRPNRLRNLLRDHALYAELVTNVEMQKLRPVEHATRESRLLRRPVILAGPTNKPLCIYGIETLEAYGRVLLERMIYGRLGIRMENGGPLEAAVGSIQSTLGHTYRDRVTDICMTKGYEIVKEKEKTKYEVMPQNGGFGPVDVFVVDRKFNRFVLVETKDIPDERTVPKLIKRELEGFSVPIEKLEKQIDWFSARIEDLKTEFEISGDANYAVVGVIVISSPRIWMYAHSEPLPVLHEKQFVKRLDTGGRFQTDPVP